MISTEAFLRHVLPHEQHWFVIASFDASGTIRHRWSDRFDSLSASVLQLDASNDAVYFAVGSYRERGRRTQANSAGARCFWLDIDAGPDKPYADAVLAAQDVRRFVAETSLPVPLFVSSGRGLHLYWVLEETLDPETWRRYAGGLKRLCQSHRLAADPARTTDIASILRPVGTTNRKSGTRVFCGPLAGPYPLAAFGRLLDEPARQPVRSSGRPTQRLAAALGDIYSDDPRFGRNIVDGCAQLRALRDSHGQLPEPQWYACLGVLAFCEDGDELGQHWSSGYDGYTERETAERLERARSLSGATTCEKFHSLNPKTCEACPHWGKIKSPISLGRRYHPAVTGPPPATDIFGEKAEAVDELPELPHDFFWRADGALITRSGTSRGDVDIVISRHPLYLDALQAGEVRGEYNLVLRQWLPGRGWRDISLASRTVFSSTSAAELASAGANIHEHTHFIRYLRGAIDLLQTNNKLTMRYDQFGWKDGDNAFLYGLDLYTPDGAQRVTGNDELQIRCKEDWVGPCKGGDLNVWKQAINALFAAGCEPQSVALLASFAAPLMRFQERDEGGAIIHLVTRESGTGKSTALIGAASVWGRREGLGLTNDDTRVSKALTLGALGNLPVVFDEISLRDPEAIRAFVINFTNGRDKMRGTRGGEIRHTASTWQTIMISAANTSLVDSLSSQNTPEAPAMRVLEFGLELPKDLQHAQGDKLRKALRANSGHAGRAFLEWLVRPANLAWTKATLERVTQQTWARTFWPSDRRFWVRTIAAIAVAGVIVRQLGLVEFSVERIMQWMLKTLNEIERVNKDWAIYALSQFLNENVSEALVMPTAWLAGTRQVPLLRPHKRLSIRYEIAGHRCFVNLINLREWLITRELSYQAFAKDLETAGVIKRRRCMVTLAAGSDLPSGQTWCMEIDTSHEMLSGLVPNEKNNVVALRA